MHPSLYQQSQLCLLHSLSPSSALNKKCKVNEVHVSPLKKREAELPLPQHTLPVRTNKDDLKLLACLLDLPVGFHQDPGEAAAGWTLKDKSGNLPRDTILSPSHSPAICHQRPGKQDPSRASKTQFMKETETNVTFLMAGNQTRAPPYLLRQQLNELP